MLYRFEFHGKTMQSVADIEVRQKMANLFQVDPEALDPLFDGSAYFKREGLDEFTAHSYDKLFKAIGAIGLVSEYIEALASETVNSPAVKNAFEPAKPLASSDKSVQAIPQATDKPTQTIRDGQCPKCYADAVEDGQCQRCGIYIAKFLDQQKRPLANEKPLANERPLANEKPLANKKPLANERPLANEKPLAQTSPLAKTEKNEADTPELDPELKAKLMLAKENSKQVDDKTLKSAHKWLSWTCLAIIIIMIIDEQLQGLMMSPFGSIDMGTWPLILAHLGLLRGCYLYTKAKDINPLFTCMGLLSFAGVAILVSIEDYENGELELFSKKSFFIAASLLVYVIWMYDTSKAPELIKNTEERAVALLAGRHEYPSEIVQNRAEVYQQETQEMKKFLEDTMTIIEKEKLRPDDISKISDRMFASLTRFEVWLNYQSFLAVKSYNRLPEYLESKARREIRDELASVLKGRVRKNDRLHLQYQKWSFGGDHSIKNPYWKELSNYIGQVRLRYHFAAQKISAPGESVFDKVDWPTPPDNSIQLRYDEPFIHIRINKKPFHDELVMAMTQQINTNHSFANSRVKMHAFFVSPDFEYYRFHVSLVVLNDYPEAVQSH